uniref:7TM_GPCR_Srx domain-containing protein n=1 Tax=Strongyloides papillosus TaxID=174720 RepID=A0A0N5BDN3_STREA
MFTTILSIVNLVIQFTLGIIAVIANVSLLYIAINNKIFSKNYANFAIFLVCFSNLIYTFATVIETFDDLFPFAEYVYNQNDLYKCLTFLMAFIFGYQMRDSTSIFIQLNKLIAVKWPLFFRKTRLMVTLLLLIQKYLLF